MSPKSQVVIQHIETIWTKQSRGGDAARKRNSVPNAVIIPKCQRNAAFTLHHATFPEGTGFSQHDVIRTSDTFEELGLRFLSYSINNDDLAIRFHRDGCNAATPSPYPHKDPFTLHYDELGRIVYNGRYTEWDTGNWWYEKHVYNMGWCLEWTPDLFVQNEPVAEFQEMARLW